MERVSRKFKEVSNFRKPISGYYLLPFRFHSINRKQEVIVNEIGDYLFVPLGTSHRIVSRNLSPEEPLYQDLIANFFISEVPIPELVEVLATRYRSRKSFLDDFTSLHIIVMTLRCDHRCHYCQVSRQSENRAQFDMSISHVDRAIDMIFRSPSPHLTIEFQGGEPLLVFENIKYVVHEILRRNEGEHRKLTFVLCTNLSRMNDEILNFCKTYSILISTSYDGPAFIHNSNRTVSGLDSHTMVLRNINICRSELGPDRVSALMTTSRLTLEHPIEIVDDYIAQGFKSIFLRAINPFGFAKKSPKMNLYQTELFLEFYKRALEHIIQVNLRGTHFVEEYAAIILTKMLTPFAVGFTDLQSPNGVVNSVMVYNYDGFVYASDESRMMAEEGDFTFRLGHLDNNSYEEIFFGAKARAIAEVWANESLPGCSECGFQSYCGADPVRNFATQGDMVGYRPTNSFCKKNMEIMRFLFDLMSSNQAIERVFRSWVQKAHV